jgi:anti-anti-sigma factor
MPDRFRRHLRVRSDGDTTVVGFRNRALDDVYAEDTGEELFHLIAEQYRPRLRVDLSGVATLNSQALGKLVVLLKRVRAAGGDLSLEKVEPTAFEVLTVTRLTSVLDVCPAV